MHSHLSVDEKVLRQVIAALDTARGCLSLVNDGIRITDLPDCRREVDAAFGTLVKILEADR